MLYHIKITNKKNNSIYFYDKDKDFAKIIKEQFYMKSDVRMDGHKIADMDKKDCYIIETVNISEEEVEQRNLKMTNNPMVINVFIKEMLFNEYKNIIDEL